MKHTLLFKKNTMFNLKTKNSVMRIKVYNKPFGKDGLPRVWFGKCSCPYKSKRTEMNINTMEQTGNRINVYLDNKAVYQLNWLIDLQNKIGAEDCMITKESYYLKVIFIVRTKIEGE